MTTKSIEHRAATLSNDFHGTQSRDTIPAPTDDELAVHTAALSRLLGELLRYRIERSAVDGGFRALVMLEEYARRRAWRHYVDVTLGAGVDTWVRI
jgi:hypothetical protein